MRIRKFAKILPSTLNNFTAPQNLREEGVVVGVTKIEDEIVSMANHEPIAGDGAGMVRSHHQVDAPLEQSFNSPSSLLGPNTSGSSLKKGRGGGKLPRGWGHEGFKRLQVSLSENGGLTGDDVVPYASACGVFARMSIRLPLNYRNWHFVPMAQKEEIWQEILRNTTMPPEGRKLTLKMIGSYWRKFKSTLKKKYFEPYKNAVAPLCGDIRVDKIQWRMLVDYWRMEQTQRRAEQNRQSRGHIMYRRHGNGRIPLSIIMHKRACKGQHI